MLKFIKTTLTGGVLFLLPLILTFVVLREAVRWIAKLLQPSVQYFFGHDQPLPLEYFLAAFLLVLIGFLAGLMANTIFGKKIRMQSEKLILRRMPGYNLFRGLTGELELGPEKSFKPALVQAGESQWQVAFIIEKHADAWYTVFLPDAPTPSSGTVQMVAAELVVELDASSRDLVNCILKVGEGLEKLAGLEAKQKK